MVNKIQQVHIKLFNAQLNETLEGEINLRNFTRQTYVGADEHDYDPKGAATFVVVVILVYGLSIVFSICSASRRKKETENQTDERQIDKYLDQVYVLREASARENYKKLKHTIIERVVSEKGENYYERSRGIRARSNSKSAQGRRMRPACRVALEAKPTSHSDDETYTKRPIKSDSPMTPQRSRDTTGGARNAGFEQSPMPSGGHPKLTRKDSDPWDTYRYKQDRYYRPSPASDTESDRYLLDSSEYTSECDSDDDVCDWSSPAPQLRDFIPPHIIPPPPTFDTQRKMAPGEKAPSPVQYKRAPTLRQLRLESNLSTIEDSSFDKDTSGRQDSVASDVWKPNPESDAALTPSKEVLNGVHFDPKVKTIPSIQPSGMSAKPNKPPAKKMAGSEQSFPAKTPSAQTRAQPAIDSSHASSKPPTEQLRPPKGSLQRSPNIKRVVTPTRVKKTFLFGTTYHAPTGDASGDSDDDLQITIV